MTSGPAIESIGRYSLHAEIASGGMATVYFGRMSGPLGFSRIVAVKRLMPGLARDPDFLAMFLDEARLAARLHHPNIVQTLDVVRTETELLLVMEYVAGESLSRLLRSASRLGTSVPVGVVAAVVAAMLHGLHAAHEAKSEAGEPLHVVHRDVNPQNLMIAADGSIKVLDFGIASAAGRSQVTREGQLKGKLSYMAPEQLWGKPIDRRVDVYAAAVVLWECLTLRKLFRADSDAALFNKVLNDPIIPPSELDPGIPAALDALVLRGLSRDPSSRFQTAREMALALEDLLPLATPSQVARWVESLADDALRLRASHVQEIEGLGRTQERSRSSVLSGIPASSPSSGLPREAPGGELLASKVETLIEGPTIETRITLPPEAPTVETRILPPPEAPTAETRLLLPPGVPGAEARNQPLSEPSTADSPTLKTQAQASALAAGPPAAGPALALLVPADAAARAPQAAALPPGTLVSAVAVLSDPKVTTGDLTATGDLAEAPGASKDRLWKGVGLGALLSLVLVSIGAFFVVHELPPAAQAATAGSAGTGASAAPAVSSAMAAASAPAVAPAASTATAPATTTARKGSPAAPRISCDPPFYLDAAGIRRVKRECLK